MNDRVLVEAAKAASLACNAAWAQGEPPHLVEAMLRAMECLDEALADIPPVTSEEKALAPFAQLVAFNRIKSEFLGLHSALLRIGNLADDTEARKIAREALHWSE